MQMSYGDLYFWLLMSTLSDPSEPTFLDAGLDDVSLQQLRGGLLQGHPKLCDLYRRVGQVEAVENFRKNRKFGDDSDYVY